MATVLSKKYTEKDSVKELILAILKLATDKNLRLLIRDEEEWKGTKLKEIARLTRILRKKI